MGELINGRTAEEIKRGLRCQGSKGNIKCSECAYCIGQFGDSDCDYECDQIDRDALALIERLEAAVPMWISVEERLPEEVCRCLVITKRHEESSMVNTATYNHMGWWTHRNFGEITHWMPLPSTEGLK